MLPAAAVDAVEAVLKGATLVDAGAALRITRSRAHGHVALVHAAARQLGLPALLGPPCRERDLAYALIISRVVAPRPKLATLAWWDDVTLGPDLGIADAPRDDVYEAMDWLLERQDDIEAALAGRHLREGGIAMFDLSSLLGGGQPLRAGRPRVLPGREERPGADRVRAAHRPRRAAPSRSGSSPGTPPTRPRSSRPWRWSAASSASASWSWSATGG